jgi:hypothetical protein
LALNNALDVLLKKEFDAYRTRGEPHPILVEAGVEARLFPDLKKLRQWRNNLIGLRWQDPLTGGVLFGAVDDVLEFPDGRMAVLDYKSSGAAEPTLYPSYQLQIDVYTFLLREMGYPIAPCGYIAFFVAVKDAGFEGRLPFKGTLREVPADPDRVVDLFREALAVSESKQMPPCGEECDLCRWFEQAQQALRPRAGGGGPS